MHPSEKIDNLKMLSNAPVRNSDKYKMHSNASCWKKNAKMRRYVPVGKFD